MRPVDICVNHRTAADEPARADATQDANRFGDSLRAAERRADGSMTSGQDAMRPDEAGLDSAREQSLQSRSVATGGAPPARHRAEAAPARPDPAVDPRNARPRARTPHHPPSPRGLRKHGDTPQPPDGVALQTLLAAAHPLLPGGGDAGPAATPIPSALTPHDIAASVTQAWLREPPAHDMTGVDGGPQWTFTLGDPMTPLAALRISGDAAAGWGLQLTAGSGLPARELAAHTERLRRRLRARGQAVDRLEVDDDPQR